LKGGFDSPRGYQARSTDILLVRYVGASLLYTMIWARCAYDVEGV
jgi:hypothetical protein